VLSVQDVSGFHHQLGIIRTRVEVAESQHPRSKRRQGPPPTSPDPAPRRAPSRDDEPPSPH
jgi:hypothetical protein